MKSPSVVLDTNILMAALRSRDGATFKILSLINTSKFQICLSVPLVLGYEEVLLRESKKLLVDEQDIQELIDYLCLVGRHQNIYFLWRPHLRDMEDDFLLELAVAAECNHIVTFNHRDFAGVERFGVQVLGPKEFLSIIGELS